MFPRTRIIVFSGFANVARLPNLTKKNFAFVWHKEQEEVLQLCMLAYPIAEEKFVVDTDYRSSMGKKK